MKPASQDRVSLFDYTVTITRKDRYLVVGSPEFGFQISSGTIELGKLSATGIGMAVMKVLSGINARLDQLERKGERPPEPLRKMRLLSREMVSAKDAARILGVSRATLRKMAYEGAIDSERTPGGHLRISLEALSDYLAKSSLSSKGAA